MLNEQVNVVVDSITSESDSVVSPISLFRYTDSLKSVFLVDSTPNYVELVEGMPLSGERTDIGFMAGILAYTIVFLIFIALLRLRGRGFFSSVYTYFFNRKKGAGFHSEGIGQNYFFVLLSICLSFSILAMLIAFLAGPPFTFSNALLFFLVIFGYYIVLLGFIRFLGWTFNGKYCASEVILSLRTSAIVLGLSISPFVLALFYVQASAVNILMYLIFSISAFILILRFIRLIKILFGYKVSILYMILYLCGLEILPILVVYKLLE